jgi:mRNA interferase MazF
MIDKAQTLPSSKVGATIGAADRETMAAVNRALAIFFGIA